MKLGWAGLAGFGRPTLPPPNVISSSRHVNVLRCICALREARLPLALVAPFFSLNNSCAKSSPSLYRAMSPNYLGLEPVALAPQLSTRAHRSSCPFADSLPLAVPWFFMPSPKPYPAHLQPPFTCHPDLAMLGSGCEIWRGHYPAPVPWEPLAGHPLHGAG